MKKRFFTACLAVLIAAGAVILPGCAPAKPADTKPVETAPVPSENHTEPETVPETEIPSAPPTEPPTDPPTVPPTLPPTEPPTVPPTEPSKEYIGKLYTRQELEAMENKQRGYGPGPIKKEYNYRPEYAIGEQKRFKQYDVNFIGPDEKKVYLTFDCGYDYIAADSKTGEKYSVTARILDILKEKKVKGMFFVTLGFCKDRPDLVRRMIDEGHIVGNHTNRHKAMPTLTIDQMAEEIMCVHNYVKEHFGYTMRFFRPPEGAFSTRSLAVTQSLGYETVHWSFAHADWNPDKQPPVDESLKKVLDRLHNGAIYLLHGMSVTNATLLPEAIDTFLEKGYSIEQLK